MIGVVEEQPQSQPVARERFGARELAKLGRLITWAHDLAGEHYKMGLDEARRVPFEVRTLASLEEREIRESDVLADIARYEYREPQFGRKRDLYRVNLQDHNILRRLGEQADAVRFAPLLLYVLTHEIVHVIRFVKFLTPFHQDHAARSGEEERVHAITQSILSRFPLRGLKRVLTRFEPMAGL